MFIVSSESMNMMCSSIYLVLNFLSVVFCLYRDFLYRDLIYWVGQKVCSVNEYIVQ